MIWRIWRLFLQRGRSNNDINIGKSLRIKKRQSNPPIGMQWQGKRIFRRNSEFVMCLAMIGYYIYWNWSNWNRSTTALRIESIRLCPKNLRILTISKIVVADALNCQKETAEIIVDQKALDVHFEKDSCRVENKEAQQSLNMVQKSYYQPC